jgi:hypothetical protein
MAILVTAYVKGQTKEGYDGVLNGLKQLTRMLPDLFFTVLIRTKKDGW